MHLDLHVVEHRLHLITLDLASVAVFVEFLESLIAFVLNFADQFHLALGDNLLVGVLIAV